MYFKHGESCGGDQLWVRLAWRFVLLRVLTCYIRTRSPSLPQTCERVIRYIYRITVYHMARSYQHVLELVWDPESI